MLGATLRRSVLPTAFLAAFSLDAAISAATITVTNTNDTGAGSLRDAINQSNASAGTVDTIAFNVTGTGCSGSPGGVRHRDRATRPFPRSPTRSSSTARRSRATPATR